METGEFEVRGDTHDELAAKAQSVCNHVIGDSAYQWQLNTVTDGTEGLRGTVTFARLHDAEEAADDWFIGDPSVRWPTPADESPRTMRTHGATPSSVPLAEAWSLTFPSYPRPSLRQQRTAQAVCWLIGHRLTVDDTNGYGTGNARQECGRCDRHRWWAADSNEWTAWRGGPKTWRERRYIRRRLRAYQKKRAA